MSGGQTTDNDTKTRLRNIDPIEFEHFVADLWELQGWNTEVSQASNDMGVDVIAERSDGVVDQKVVIQAKRYSEDNKIGRPDIQQYNSLKRQVQDADSVAVVTTSSFSSHAEEWASEHNVKLVDCDDIIGLLREKEAMYILDDYAPPLRADDLDPVDHGAEPTPTDELGVEIEGEEDVDLPEQLADEDTRKKIAASGIGIGLLLIWNPMGIQLPVGALGMLVLLGGIAVYAKPAELWDAVTPTREVYREFGHGGVVALDGGDIQYEPPGGAEPTVFEDADEQTRRQRAVVYGALDKYVGGNLTVTEKGMLPTTIANEGAQVIAAYRFAVHGENPATIASEMSMSQQEVIDHLRAVAA
jgi:hypothetical protein